VNDRKYPVQTEEDVYPLSADQSNFELEIDVLSTAVANHHALAIALENLEERDFSLPSARAAFRVMVNMVEKGELPDHITLRGRVDQQLLATMNAPGLASRMDAYVRQLREAAKQRELRGLGMELAESRGDASVLSGILDDAVARMARREKTKGVDLSQALMSIKEKKQTGQIQTGGIDYPWHRININSRGLRAGWLCYLAGRPRQGKTAAAIEIAISAAKQGKRVLFDSLEMDQDELAVRVAQRMGMDSEAFYMGDMSEHDWHSLDLAIQFPPLRNIQIEFAPSVAKLTTMVRAYKPELVVVDYVQLMEHANEQRVEGTTQTSNGLKRLARQYKTPVLALSQLSRPAKDARHDIPDLSDLRDSGSLEQDADQVVFIWREMDRTHNLPTPQGMFILAKARMGRACKQVFRFDGARQTFAMVDSSHEEEKAPAPAARRAKGGSTMAAHSVMDD
jgi:replicative DNA helicase